VFTTMSKTLSTLSADSLKTWDKCPQQFEWKVVKRLNWPSETGNFTLGKTVHKLMDCQAKGMDVAPLVATCPPAIQQSWHTLNTHPSVEWQVVASEWGFEFPVTVASAPDETCWITGRIDRLALHNNTMWIIDWKTGTAAPKHPERAWQTGIYAMAVQQAWATLPPGPWHQQTGHDQQPNKLKMAYVSVTPPTVQQQSVSFSEADFDHWQQRLTNTLEAIATATREQTFSPVSPCPDRWCPYQPICPVTSGQIEPR
jgi:hypothetical protein